MHKSTKMSLTQRLVIQVATRTLMYGFFAGLVYAEKHIKVTYDKK